MTDSSSGAGKAGCGCMLPFLMGSVLALVAAAFYFGDIHNKQTLHAGDETRFDPISSYSFANGLAGDGLRFVKMHAKFVRSDGTLDLSADYGPVVTYQWIGAVRGVEGRPVGAGGGATRVPVVTVRATNFGFEAGAMAAGGGQYYDFNLGLRRTEVLMPVIKFLKPIDPPKCSLKKMWAEAIKAGAPEDAVAEINYDSRGWEFEIDGTEIDLKFDHNCEQR